MPKKRRKLDVVCQNRSCFCYLKKNLKNIIRNGKKQNKTQNYKCTKCGVQFVRTKGTLFYHKKLDKKEVGNICRHLAETNSFRGIARQTQHNKNTICSYVDLLGQHCEQVNDFLLKDIKLGTNEIDEMWNFVKKKEKNVNEEIKDFPDYETGDTYVYLDIKRETNLFVAFSVGKWTQNTCNDFYELIAKRTQQPTYKKKIRFCTDCNKQNLPAITKNFHQDSVQYGQVVKEKEGQIVIGTHPRQVLGAMPFSEISIAHVDGLCSKLRARAGFFVRKTRNFAKRRTLIPNVLQVWQLNHNFIEAKNGETPAMKERLTTKIWDWNKVFAVRLTFII